MPHTHITNHKTIFIILFLLFTILSLNITICAEKTPQSKTHEPIQLYYFERVPYSVTTEHVEVTGFIATPSSNAFKKAGISFQWKEVPFKRQIQIIKYNKKMACGIGWFKTPERESFALFTHDIYQDKPAITLSKAGNDALNKHQTLVSLLSDRKIKLLVKIGFSYGTYVDDLLEQYAPQKVSVASNNEQMLQMILAGRADYFFVSEEEADYLVTSSGFNVSQFQKNRYSDMPKGNRRYIACSRQVPSLTIDLLNELLK